MIAPTSTLPDRQITFSSRFAGMPTIQIMIYGIQSAKHVLFKARNSFCAFPLGVHSFFYKEFVHIMNMGKKVHGKA